VPINIDNSDYRKSSTIFKRFKTDLKIYMYMYVTHIYLNIK